MPNQPSRAHVLSCVLSLIALTGIPFFTGCAGGSASTGSVAPVTDTVGGTVSGLTGSGLVLQDKGGNNLAVPANGSFSFPNALASGTAYSVTVLTQPSSPSQTCVVTSGSGTVSGSNVTNVVVTCTTNTYALGGTVSGLTGSGLVLQDNGANNLAVSANGSFSFTTSLASGTAYSVTVLTQPTSPSQACIVTAPSGTLSSSNVTSVSVTCTTNTYTVGGTVSGLTGSGLVLQDNGGNNLAVSANGFFTFATAFVSGTAYNVTALTQPTNPGQTCGVASGSGTVTANVTSVQVTCTLNNYTVGGTVSGLTGSGLVLQNNGGNNLAVSANGSFAFATALASGTAYSVTVLTQPSNPSQACVVTSGNGVADATVNTVVVTCLAYALAGPSIDSFPPTVGVVGKPIQYQLVTSSNTPATLAYSLSTAPAGMSIGTTTGLMQWTPAPNQAGDQSVTILAQDSGGQTSQSFTLSVFGIAPETSVLISAASGGAITVNDPSSTINGLSINIPAGALASDTTVTLSALISPATLGGTPRFFMEGFSIDPDGTPLAVPATITVPYNVSRFSTSEGIPSENFLSAYYVQASTGNLQFLNFSVDTVNHAVTGTIPHFSGYIIANNASLCPPQTSLAVCPSTYTPPANPSLLPPALMIHGFQRNCQMGDDSTWGNLRNLLSLQLDSGLSGRIDAWEFNWDSSCTPFEISAGHLEQAIAIIRGLYANQPSHPVNIVTHSFGGILVRTYLAGLGTTPYNHDVNSVISLATPYQGVGGNFSIGFASACAFLNSYYTCFEAGTGDAGNPPGPSEGYFPDRFGVLSYPPNFVEGSFLTKLNSIPLPTLQSANQAVPQYDIIIGQKFSSCSPGTCLLQTDDGLITTTGNQFCTGSVACTQGTVQQDINPGSLPTHTGFCHSVALMGFGCDLNNIPIAEINATAHPLWDKICNFLGCLPAINVTVVTVSPAAEGTVTSSPNDPGQPGAVNINCGQNASKQQCTGLYPAGTAVTLTATPSSTFAGWTGACASAGTNSQCTLTTLPVDQNLGGDQVTATFAPAPTYTYTGNKFNSGSGECILGGCPLGSSITITVTYYPGTYAPQSCTISDGVTTAACGGFTPVPPFDSWYVTGNNGDIDMQSICTIGTVNQCTDVAFYGVGVAQKGTLFTNTPGTWNYPP